MELLSVCPLNSVNNQYFSPDTIVKDCSKINDCTVFLRNCQNFHRPDAIIDEGGGNFQVGNSPRLTDWIIQVM